MSLDLSAEESGGGGGHEAGGMMRWLLTYADMITLLMAFFIMMYAMSSVSTDKFRKAAASLRAEFGPSTSDAGPGGGGGLLPHRLSGPATLLPLLEEDIKLVEDHLQEYVSDNELQDLVHTNQEVRGLVISLASDNLLFSVGEAELRPPALAILDQIAGLLQDLPNPVVIEGHTCALPINTPRYPSNWELSAARACAVVHHLIDRWRIDPLRLAATGYAYSRPVASNETEEGRVLNRRVNIVILTQTQPSLTEGAASDRTPEEPLEEQQPQDSGPETAQ